MKRWRTGWNTISGTDKRHPPERHGIRGNVADRGKIVGGVYDDRFLVKPVKAAKDMMPEAELELPYEGAKEMILVDNVENKEFLRDLLEAMYGELPAPKKKK